MTTNVYFIQIEYHEDTLRHPYSQNYVICGIELKLVESALERPYFDDFDIQTKHLVARNITEKQLKKFNHFDSWKLLDNLTETEGNFTGIDYGYRLGKVQIWIDKKDEWYEVHKELEEAKFNPRNPLGKLEFVRRAEEDGIEYEK